MEDGVAGIMVLGLGDLGVLERWKVVFCWRVEKNQIYLKSNIKHFVLYLLLQNYNCESLNGFNGNGNMPLIIKHIFQI